MMGLPISMVLPQVVGYRLIGEMNQFVTSTDVVLTITKVSYLNNGMHVKDWLKFECI